MGWEGECPLGVPSGQCRPIGSALKVAAGHYPGESLLPSPFAPVLCRLSPGNTERIGGSRPGTYGPPPHLPTPPQEGLSGCGLPPGIRSHLAPLFSLTCYPWLVPGSRWWSHEPAFARLRMREEESGSDSRPCSFLVGPRVQL